MKTETAFMRFWRLVNVALAARNALEMLFGEARSLWTEFTQTGWEAA